MTALPHVLFAWEMGENFGHVSKVGEVARAMAKGAIANSRASLAVSVTGIAGPGGGTAEKPVGLVWFGIGDVQGQVRAERHVFEDNGRRFIREMTVETALLMLRDALLQH